LQRCAAAGTAFGLPEIEPAAAEATAGEGFGSRLFDHCPRESIAPATKPRSPLGGRDDVELQRDAAITVTRRRLYDAERVPLVLFECFVESRILFEWSIVG
jgi:hypothetical protein